MNNPTAKFILKNGALFKPKNIQMKIFDKLWQLLSFEIDDCLAFFYLFVALNLKNTALPAAILWQKNKGDISLLKSILYK